MTHILLLTYLWVLAFLGGYGTLLHAWKRDFYGVCVGLAVFLAPSIALILGGV